MTDGIATGWQHAAHALGFILGALPGLFALALIILAVGWLALELSVEIPHRLAVRRVRRQTRRTGRTTS